jgi:hypothetical protein
VIPYDTDELENLGKNDDTHVLLLRLSHDTIFKKFKKMELDFVLVRTPLNLKSILSMLLKFLLTFSSYA